MRGLSCAWACVVALAGSSACRQPNPEWLGPAGEEPTSGTSTSDALASSTSDGDGSSGSAGDTDATGDTTGPVPSQCAPASVPGQGECPAACNACEDGRCIVDCGVRDCGNATVACPAGWPCDFLCTSDTACKRGVLECAPDRDCTVDCQGFEACQRATVECGVGTCAVTCGADPSTCRQLAVACGPADATVTCDGPSTIGLEPLRGSSCACEGFGCEG